MWTGKTHRKRVSTVRTKLKQPQAAPPVIFRATIQKNAIRTSVNSQTATTAKSQKEEVVPVQTPHQSNYISPVSPSVRSNTHEKDTQDKSSSSSFREKLQNFEDNQTFKQIPVVRMPVLLAQEDISIHIAEEVQIPYPVQTITNLTWRLQSLSYNILALEKRLTIRGLLIPEIRYVTYGGGDERGFSTYISWYESTNIEFMYPPVLPTAKESKVYTFGTEPSKELVTHREQRDRHAEPPFADLRESHIVSSEHLTSERSKSNVSLQVMATLSIDIFQTQLVPKFTQ